ncbi:DUF5626 family protein [Oenococcus sicerae]|uniref:DUF5626 domain-containing protein n=1 Tax=Oenococcus sicerae TaxID=2203724 RepID=A0AAJ1R8L5_9LACO|nr:DUF5626 family protein [Oenococcus sicerae]MDN6900164.1 hypothetical protein [Oenococcus sicerae]
MSIKTGTKFFLITLFSVLFYLNFSNIAQADDTLIYDLQNNQSQSFQGVDDQGNSESITITPDAVNQNSNNYMILAVSLANRSYTISKNGLGWSVSYHIGVNNNHITSAYGLKASASLGSLRDSHLSRISNREARWTADHMLPVVSTNISCTAIISNSQLLVS